MAQSHQPYAGGSVEERDAVAPMRDYGFFAPDSVARRVWSYPTSMLLGFSRAVTIEHLDPDLAAAVIQSGQVKQRTPLRFDRTMQYFATILYGDAESVLKSSDILMKIHQRATGVDPVTGRTFAANNPDSQLWIHLTAWHSILITYEMFGPGRLSAEDEATYWEECVTAAKFQTIDTDTMPRTREDVAAYFDDFRKNMVASDGMLDMFDFLVNMQLSSLPDEVPAPIRKALNALTSRAVVATMPKWMREMGGVPQSAAVDVATIAALKPVLLAISKSNRIMLPLLRVLTPRTYPILAPFFLGIAPENPHVYDEDEARAAFGYPDKPRAILERQVAAREAGEAPAPYEHDHHDDLLAFATAGEDGGLLENADHGGH
ncbi:MAG TPA: oxygenase MpaB family protein [Nocardioides sp.]|nr:oxygenase MpaB family protein [Nocardioides sp.]